MSRKKITLQDLSNELGLSVQTISKALRGRPGMSEQTRSKVIKLARERGYLTREQEQSLGFDGISPYPVMQRRFILLHNALSLNFNKLLLQGLRERFLEFGHTVQPLLLPSELRPEQFDAWCEEQDLLYSDGIFIAPRLNDDRLEEKLLQLPIPRILLNYPPPGAKADSVIWDVYEAVYQAVRHLIAFGHRNIMYAGDAISQRGFVLRWQAFRDAMAEAGLDADPEQHSVSRDANGQWIREFKQLYRRTNPTALLCAIDEEVGPLLSALQEMNVSVPHQCSVVACLNEQSDKLPLCSRPLLLIKETGYRAADRMLWRIANPTLPFEHVRIRGDFFIGNTTFRINL